MIGQYNILSNYGVRTLFNLPASPAGYQFIPARFGLIMPNDAWWAGNSPASLLSSFRSRVSSQSTLSLIIHGLTSFFQSFIGAWAGPGPG